MHNYNRGHSLLDLAISLLIVSLLSLFLLNTLALVMRKTKQYAEHYHEMQKILLFRLDMRKLLSNVNYAPCRKLTDLGLSYSNLIESTNNHQTLILHVLKDPIYLLKPIDNYHGITESQCNFKAGDPVILTSCTKADLNMVDDIFSKGLQKCSIQLKKSINLEDQIYISKWQTIKIACQNNVLYINSGHNETWLKNIAACSFNINNNKVLAKINSKDKKYFLKWPLY